MSNVGDLCECGHEEGFAQTEQGGTEPGWGPNSRELFFRKGLDFLVVEIGEGPAIGTPKKLFTGSYVAGFNNRPNYDVSSDGQRFVMVGGRQGLTKGRLDVLLNFEQELERVLPPRE